MQQQQTMLRQILHNQSAMEEKQALFAAKLTDLEKQVQQQASACKSNKTNGKRKRTVAGTLSVS